MILKRYILIHAVPTEGEKHMSNWRAMTGSNGVLGRGAYENERLPDLLIKAHHLVTERLYAEVKSQGVGMIEWRILAALSGQNGLTMSDIANRVLTKQPTLTKAVDRMERQGLVARRTPEHDRRRTQVFLTDRGFEIASRLIAATRAREDATLAEHGDVNLRQLKTALGAMIDYLTTQRQPLAPRMRYRSAPP